MKKIALVAACDRYNFGDVLLPKIFEMYWRANCGNKINFHYFALSNADLRKIGGNITKPVREINQFYDAIVVVGGEILTAQYYNMYLNLQTSKIWIGIISLFHSIVPKKMINRICKKILRGKYLQPWTIKPISKYQKVIYNSVGGIGIDTLDFSQKEELLSLIGESAMFSVRDEITYKKICRLSSTIGDQYLIPDTAIIMSDYYKADFLNSRTSCTIRNMVKGMGKYYVLQINRRFGVGEERGLSNIIKSIYQRSGIKCILLPIGRAQGHEDIIPLEKIYNLCNPEYCELIRDANIYEIIMIINNSTAFLGTSLHGVITAASYEIPHAVISDNAVKTIIYLNTWKTTKNVTVRGVGSILSFLKLGKESINLQNIHSCKYKVNDYLHMVVDCINN